MSATYVCHHEKCSFKTSDPKTSKDHVRIAHPPLESKPAPPIATWPKEGADD